MSSLNVKYCISIAASEFTFTAVTFKGQYKIIFASIFTLWYLHIESWLKKLIPNLTSVKYKLESACRQLSTKTGNRETLCYLVRLFTNVTNSEIHTMYKVRVKGSAAPALKAPDCGLTLISHSYTCLDKFLGQLVFFFLDQSHRVSRLSSHVADHR